VPSTRETKSNIERWLETARAELRVMPDDHPTRWMLARQVDLIAKAVKLFGDQPATRQ
jgi:hypothetical protein